MGNFFKSRNLLDCEKALTENDKYLRQNIISLDKCNKHKNNLYNYLKRNLQDNEIDSIMNASRKSVSTRLQNSKTGGKRLKSKRTRSNYS